ncbi:hypothetical protein BXZ70DRAFT_641162 [Cristinia sonorae]|uniref:GLTSCR protein conserved domain-containing protein n=1 Tax=Cristinia sonorae TaxID=1940300 RepID=A0A8K0UFE7_9AGAR|nr:hypothetical protein BXZ70DRAFT_641162 [Cristinia sonorae]
MSKVDNLVSSSSSASAVVAAPVASSSLSSSFSSSSAAVVEGLGGDGGDGSGNLNGVVRSVSLSGENGNGTGTPSGISGAATPAATPTTVSGGQNGSSSAVTNEGQNIKAEPNATTATVVPPPPTGLLRAEEVVAERWMRSQYKKRTAEEAGITSQTAARVCARLAEDHAMVLKPDVETPFVDKVDVVKRLLPYHVFQHPMEDLIPLTQPAGKGKMKATEEDLLREEIAETKFALECWKRRAALEKRFRRARVNSGKREAFDDQAYWLAQAVLEGDRTETANLTAELRAARQELDKLEREKRAAQAAATVTAAPASAPSRPYYPPIQAASTSTATPYASQYRNYSPYTYTQGYNTQYAYAPYAVGGTGAPAAANSVYGAYTTRTAAPGSAAGSASAPVPASAPPTSHQAAAQTPTGTSANGSAAPTPVSMPVAASTVPGTATASTAYTIALPSASLTALSALGIVPIPAANAPAAGQPQPAAVLKGTTNNGTIVSLEINVSALQQNQRNGLAVILGALTSRGLSSAASAAAASSGNVGAGADDQRGGEGGTKGGTSTASSAGPVGVSSR